MMKILSAIATYLILINISFLQANEKPNILWITSEDNGIKWLSCYGGKNTNTPNIDSLASEGFRYLYCFDNAAVCAPTRSSWITGMHALSIGTHPMRSGFEVPKEVTFYNQQLLKAGYWTSNCNKTDYNLRSPVNPNTFWNYRGKFEESFKGRKNGQPFFTVLNIMDSHESRAFGSLKKDSKDPKAMKLRPYHPDIPEMRETYAIYSRSVEKMDERVGEAIQLLKDKGVYEDTIIIYNSDHGGVLPRSKRFLYSSGIHCPLIVRIPAKWKNMWPAAKPGMTVDRIVSFIDMPKTWLSLAGAEIPENYQGRVFLGKNTEPTSDFHFSWRERADDRFDNTRVMRGKRFAYHKNYAPYAPNGQFLTYMHNMKGTSAWEQYHKAGKTNEVTGRFFEPRVSEEFYDNKTDFDNVRNLIKHSEHQTEIAKLKRELRRQQLKYFDSGLLPEKMRGLRARENNITIYEMVRNPNLYPLEKYLDAADLALTRDKKNLGIFQSQLSDKDEGMRFWAVVGLLLLEKDAAPAKEELIKALKDNYKEVSAFAAWVLFKIGEKEKAFSFFKSCLQKDVYKERMLANILDWMGDGAKPVLAQFEGQEMKKSFLADVVLRAGINVTIQKKQKKKK